MTSLSLNVASVKEKKKRNPRIICGSQETIELCNPESLRIVLLTQMAPSQVARQKSPKYGTRLLSLVKTQGVEFKVKKILCNRNH